MSDIDALVATLSTLAGKDGESFAHGARVLSQGGTPEPVAAILNAVDDTVLERLLRLDVDGQQIDLIAAGRRLRGIHAAAGADAATQALFGKVLSREEPDVVTAIGEFLTAQCATAQRVSLQSLPPKPFGNGGERGISAAGLAQLWEVGLTAEALPPMRRFLAANANALTATMHVKDGEMQGLSGDYKTLQTIWNQQVIAFREAHAKFQANADEPALICLEGAIESGDAIALAIEGDDVALISCGPEAMGALLSSWRMIAG